MIFDQAKADQFADRLVNALNLGALCLMSSIGHRTGLFDVMSELPASSSSKIAEKAGLNERYVREWLGSMVTSQVVECDEEGKKFNLPKEHASFLTRKAAPNNIAVFTQYITILGAIEDEILYCFNNGGGVPYSKYPRFHSVMAEESAQTVLPSLMDSILPLVPSIQEKLQKGIKVLDVGCGSGRAINLMASHYPKSEFTGIDLSEEAIGRAEQETADKGLANVHFQVKDLTHFEREADSESFDFVTTFDAVHDQAKPLSVLKGIAKSLKPDGVYLMQDIHASSHIHQNQEHPIGPLLYTISCLHCMTVSLAQGGDGLGAMWGRELADELLKEAGFSSIEIHRLDHDFQNDYYVIRK